jgi:MOSC domain-containing protein YiiM|nr:MOSC domain-containing protein [Candidatus Krumholzibacteria bacterium]
MTGRVAAVCTSAKKGVVKEPLASVELVAGHGLDGDAHAGNWHRQVSLLATESIEKIRKIIPELKDGAFAENIVTEGVDLLSLGLGDRIELGDGITLEVTQIGKECHNSCAIKEQTGDCVMPREGIFCRVLAGGTLKKGDPVRIPHKRPDFKLV